MGNFFCYTDQTGGIVGSFFGGAVVGALLTVICVVVGIFVCRGRRKVSSQNYFQTACSYNSLCIHTCSGGCPLSSLVATRLSEPQQKTSSWKVACFPWFSPFSCQLGTNGYAFPLYIGVVSMSGSCHVVQFLLLQLSKQLTLIGGPSIVPSTCSSMCSVMYSKERLFSVL